MCSASDQPYWINVEQEGYLRPIPREFRVKHVGLPEGQIERVQSGGVLVQQVSEIPSGHLRGDCEKHNSSIWGVVY